MARSKNYTIQGFPEKLNKLIYIDNDLNCVEVAKAIGCERKTIYHWLYGASVPNAVMVARLCSFFKVSADWLLGLKGE